MTTDKLQRTLQLHRRWHGVGALLFVVFYCIFFASHLKLAQTAIYLKNDAVVAADTQFFFNDMTAPREQAGSYGSGKGNAFLLLHHEPCRLLTAGLTPLIKNPTTAARHAMAVLTAGAAALTVVFLYLALLWAGVGRLRAVLLAGILGMSTAVLLFAVLPQPQIFNALGLMAAIAAVARDRSGRWWEFTVAATYAACCSLWNVVPMLVLALLRGLRSAHEANPRPVLNAFLSAGMLAIVALGAMRLQGWVYPRAGDVSPVSAVQGSLVTVAEVVKQTPALEWSAQLQDVFFSSVVAPEFSALRTTDVAPTTSGSRVFALADGHWLVLDPQHGIWACWLALLVLAAAGLPWAMWENGIVLAALLVCGWLVWFNTAVAAPGERLLQSALWTPLVVFLVGAGLEQHMDRWRWLRWPLTLLLGGFLALVAQRNVLFMEEVARVVAL